MPDLAMPELELGILWEISVIRNTIACGIPYICTRRVTFSGLDLRCLLSLSRLLFVLKEVCGLDL